VPSLPFEDEDLPLFTVGQVSGMLEVQQAFLRRLDEFGVVRPSRSGGGQRRYTRREVVTVQYVVQLTSEGMTLAAIRRVLELEAQVRDLERKCAELQALLRRLRDEISERDEPAPYGEAGRASGPARSGQPDGPGRDQTRMV
jgi:MerR family transcriptional regulator, heat shock protein HspR